MLLPPETTFIIHAATRGCLSKTCKHKCWNKGPKVIFPCPGLSCIGYSILPGPVSCCPALSRSVRLFLCDTEPTGARCCCVDSQCGRTKTVLSRQAWSREQHRILLQTSQCLCQVLPSNTQQTLCSVSPHSQLCPVCLPFSPPSPTRLLLYAVDSASRV